MLRSITPFTQDKAVTPGGRKGLRALWGEDQGSCWKKREEGCFAGQAANPLSVTAKKAGGDELHAGPNWPLLELLSKHGRPIRFQMNPAARHPWPRCFRNAGSEFRDISGGYLYPSPGKAVKAKFRSRWEKN